MKNFGPIISVSQRAESAAGPLIRHAQRSLPAEPGVIYPPAEPGDIRPDPKAHVVSIASCPFLIRLELSSQLVATGCFADLESLEGAALCRFSPLGLCSVPSFPL